MTAQRIFLWLVLLFIILVFRPKGIWREIQNIWRRREFIIRVLITFVSLYFLYGLYMLYSQWKLSW